MRSLRTIFILAALGFCPGMMGDGCAQLDSGAVLDSSAAPIIIPFGPSTDTLDRSFKVDLTKHPNTSTVTWDFGDGGVVPNLQRSAGQSVSHTFTRAGTFTVKVHLFSARDYVNNLPPQLIGTGELPVTVQGPNTPPIADFIIQELTASDATPGARRLFRATLSRDPDGEIVSHVWDFGDGNAGEGQIVNHTYLGSGRFVIRLTVTDDRGASATTTRSIVINQRPIPAFTFDITGPNLLTVNFDATGSSDPDGVITQFRWDFGDDSAEATGAVVTRTYAAPDDFSVTLRVTDDFGQTASLTQVVSLTGVDPFVRSTTPSSGVENDASVELTIEGENFEAGATVQLRRGATTIDATSATVQNSEIIVAVFDLTGAVRGGYDIIVNNPLGGAATLMDGFTIVSADLVRLTTSLGEVVVQLVPDAPITTANFLQYVEDDFYNGTIFHRIVPDFVVQGGGFLPGMVPQSGLRPPIQNEFSPLRSNIRGTLAMAKIGGDPDSATSQFFFNLGDNSANLDNQNGGFTVFANVIIGMDVVDRIAEVPLNGETPVDDVLIIEARRE